MADEITPDDVQAVVSKLEEWGNSLPEKERVVLNSILSNVGEESEVEGFMMPGSPGSAPSPFVFQPGALSMVHKMSFGMDSDPVFIQISNPRQQNSM